MCGDCLQGQLGLMAAAGSITLAVLVVYTKQAEGVRS